MRRIFLIFLFILPGALVTGAFAEAAPPNVILVITDDQGYGDFGATGNAIIETPHIDAMAARSAWMKTFYVSPVCSPTRANLMTGRYNYRTRCIDTYLGRSMLDPDEVTLAEALRDGGYATGIFGKWHLGDAYPMRPQDQGFEEALVLRGGGLGQPADHLENGDRYTDPWLWHNGQAVHTRGYCTDVYFDGAMRFMEEQHQFQRPFFTYIATNAPHGPYHDVPENLRAHYMEKDLDSLMADVPEARREGERDRLARIAAMITNVDENMGRLFARLDELGITDNTLVIFLTDNGPNTRRFVGPFRGMKSDVLEGGVRTPLWMQWPARLAAGTSREEPVAHYDLMPTILEACGVAPPAGTKLDGRSFLPLLLDADAPWPDRYLHLQTHRGDVPQRYHQFMIRDSQWKLVHPSGFGKESFQGEPAFELYDLLADPGERSNLAETHPEIVARLRSAYDVWFDDVSSTRPGNYAPPRILVGADAAPETVLTRQDWRGGTWAPDSTGYWLVDVVHDGAYDVTVHFQDEAPEGMVAFNALDQAFNVSLAEDASEIKVSNLALHKGQQRVEATLTSGEKTWGAYQITLTRTAR